MRFLSFLLSFCLLPFTFYLSNLSAESSNRFAVGVMRRDGVLIPFAAFDGKRWVVIWSAPKPTLEIPINLESVPKSWWGPAVAQRDWQLWPFGGGGGVEPITARVTQPDWVPSYCARQIALRTDYRSAAPPVPESTQPFPKDGVAFAPPQPLERVEMLQLDSSEAAGLRPALNDAFNKAERELAARAPYPIKQQARESVTVDVERLFAYGTSPRYYYVESVRSYSEPASSREAQCALAFGTGWYIKDEKGVRRIDQAVDLLPCDRRGATYMLPLGVVRGGDGTFWLAQYAGWRHERYMVIALKKDTVEAATGTWGGGC